MSKAARTDRRKAALVLDGPCPVVPSSDNPSNSSSSSLYSPSAERRMRSFTLAEERSAKRNDATNTTNTTPTTQHNTTTEKGKEDTSRYRGPTIGGSSILPSTSSPSSSYVSRDRSSSRAQRDQNRNFFIRETGENKTTNDSNSNSNNAKTSVTTQFRERSPSLAPSAGSGSNPNNLRVGFLGASRTALSPPVARREDSSPEDNRDHTWPNNAG